MLPEPSPTLKGKCAKEFAKRMKQAVSVETVQVFREAERVSEKIRQIKII